MVGIGQGAGVQGMQRAPVLPRGKGAAMPRKLKKMNDAMELLAPAGDEAALRAAVCAGANAVYLGYSQFGARAAAANFDAEALERAVAYAHLHHVRVHVTVNTLVKQNEIEDVTRALATIAACRADAVIVQDMGVASLVRELFPTLELHASTQMTLHTAAGARFAMAQGFRRVVLARECTLPAIAEVAATGVDTEVFVHGALCAGVSGQCLLSSMAGGRSGNRGRCAQPCRQVVTLGDTTAALLSMRDLCLRDYLPELQGAGVKALKIEGRLKRPEYVAVVTDSYRRALDALARGEFKPMDAKERNSLLQIFHRGGFTTGHAMGAEDAELCSIERVNHGGVTIGTILSVQNGLATATLQTALHDGDSLRIDGVEDVELRYSGHREDARATLRLRPGEHVKPGSPVVRTANAEQLQWAQSLTERPIPVAMRATIRAGEPIRLWVSDGENAAESVGEIAQTPIKRALVSEDIARSLSKLGDTPFALQGDVAVETDEAFVPVSALNALRRAAVEGLEKARRAAFFGSKKEALLAQSENLCMGGTGNDDSNDRQAAVEPPRITKERSTPSATTSAGMGKPSSRQGALKDKLAVSFDDASAGEIFLRTGANLLLYTPRDWRAQALRAELPKLPQGAWLVLPSQLSDAAFRQAWPVVQAQGDRVSGVVLGSVGQLGFPITLPVALGDGVPITNREAAKALLTERISFCTLWPELSREELETLVWNEYPCLLRVYGRERVMLLNHCPERVALGLKEGRANCGLCKQGDRACASPDATLTDRKGYRFPVTKVRMPEGCVIEVYNALPTDLTKQEKARKALGAGMLLSFSVEPLAEQIATVERFAALMRDGIVPASDKPTTGGHFLRGVE